MRLLLDTHIWLWGLLEPERLTQRVAAELEDPSNELWLSSISIWEVLVLVEKGRVILNTDATAWVRSVISKHPFKEAPVNNEVAIQSRLLTLPYEDPADRFLLATAFVFDLTLVTADERLIHSSGERILANN